MKSKAFPVAPGSPQRADDWNDVLGRVSAIEERNTQGQANTILQALLTEFSYSSSDGDVLLCKAINADGTLATADEPIAKPATQRPSITTRGPHVYTYISDFERDDDLAGNVERQVLVPAYEIGDLIYAMRVTCFQDVVYTSPVHWLSVEVDGRAWAQKFGT